jgi:hypothetical protein
MAIPLFFINFYFVCLFILSKNYMQKAYNSYKLKTTARKKKPITYNSITQRS